MTIIMGSLYDGGALLVADCMRHAFDGTKKQVRKIDLYPTSKSNGTLGYFISRCGTYDAGIDEVLCGVNDYSNNDVIRNIRRNSPDDDMFEFFNGLKKNRAYNPWFTSIDSFGDIEFHGFLRPYFRCIVKDRYGNLMDDEPVELVWRSGNHFIEGSGQRELLISEKEIGTTYENIRDGEYRSFNDAIKGLIDPMNHLLALDSGEKFKGYTFVRISKKEDYILVDFQEDLHATSIPANPFTWYRGILNKSVTKFPLK